MSSIDNGDDDDDHYSDNDNNDCGDDDNGDGRWDGMVQSGIGRQRRRPQQLQ